MLANKLMGASAAEKLYVDDVFSTYLYTGTDSAQTMPNGIDLYGKGGMVLLSMRSSTHPYFTSDLISNIVFDSKRAGNTTGYGSYLVTSSTSGNQGPYSTPQTNPIVGGGFTVASWLSYSQTNYVSWTFRKAPKFFDVVTGTGTGVYNHSLAVTPGLVIIKSTTGTSDWFVMCRTQNGYGFLNQTAAFTGSLDGISTYAGATATTFTAGNYFGASDQWVAYLFAHDPSADGIIQCGSFTTDGSGNATVNTIGWEPQWGLFKASSGTGDWIILDQMRGWNMTANDAKLAANTSAAEVTTTEYGNPTATGFEFKGGSASTTYTYTVIRRPNKPPTTGTQVYNAIARTGTGAAATVTGVGFAPDVALINIRDIGTRGIVDRLRGAKQSLFPAYTDAEKTSASTKDVGSFDMGGISFAGGNDQFSSNSTFPYINHFFRRAPGFFDVVCYTGTGAARTVNHNLGVVPELIIVKHRNYPAAEWWYVFAPLLLGNSSVLALHLNNAAMSASAYINGSPTVTSLSLKSDGGVNGNGINYVSYIFATLPGISKVGSYTGNGSSQTINCGFAAGARFILIKRTDASGDWFFWDSARGIVAANDPHLSLNTTAAEVTTDDSVDPDNSGFIVNQNTATNINVLNGQYIYLCVA